MERASVRLVALVALLVALAVGGMWWATRGPVTEEDRVRVAIHQVAEGAEGADLGAVMLVISERYDDGSGVGKDAIRGFLFRQFQRRGPIHVTLGPITVVFQGEASATASFQALLLERSPGTPWPADGDAQYFEVVLQLEEAEWRVVSHERRPAGEGPPPGL